MKTISILSNMKKINNKIIAKIKYDIQRKITKETSETKISLFKKND